MDFLKPVKNRSGMDWWLSVQPVSLTISFYLETPLGPRQTLLLVYSNYDFELASMDLDEYDHDQWNTVELPLVWSGDPGEFLAKIEIDPIVTGAEVYSGLLRVCENDPPPGWLGEG